MMRIAQKSTKSLAEALTDDEWTDYLERADITDAVVKVPNPDYDENEDDVDDKYTEEYRSARQIVRNGGVGDDEDRSGIHQRRPPAWTNTGQGRDPRGSGIDGPSPAQCA